MIDALDSVASDNTRESIEWANSLQKAYILALDVPSGLDPDSGQSLSHPCPPSLPHSLFARFEKALTPQRREQAPRSLP